MPHSYSVTVSTGATRVVSVPFPYNRQEDVHVYVNGVERSFSSLTWTTPSTIQLPDSSASLNGKQIVVRRLTTKGAPRANFEPGGLDDRDLDDNFFQLLYLQQEAEDAHELALSRTVFNTEVYDAGGRRVGNAGLAVHGQDLVNLDLVRGSYGTAIPLLDGIVTYPTQFAVQLATIASGYNFLQTKGALSPGDLGGALYKKVASEPSHGGKLQSGDGAWWEIAEPVLHSNMFGTVGDDYEFPESPTVEELENPPHDNTAAFAAFLSASKALKREAKISPGRFYKSGNSYLATHAVSGNAWDVAWPSKLTGHGVGVSRVRSDATGYAFCQESILTSSPNHKANRTQHGPVEIAHFTLVGPMSYDNPGRGLGIDNSTMPYVHDMHIWGFTGRGRLPDPLYAPALSPPTTPDPWDEGDWIGGCGLVIRGYAKGGSYGAIVERVRFGNSGPFYSFSKATGLFDEWLRPINTSYTCTDIRDLEKVCNRTHAWAWGEYTANGKSNDIIFRDCRLEDALVYGICDRGTMGDRTREIVGSSANVRTERCVGYSQLPGRIEIGLIEEAIDSTHFRLRTDPDTLIDYPDGREGLYVGFGIQFFKGATYAAAYITAMTADGVVTLDRAITYQSDSSYMIQYADPRSQYDLNPNVGPSFRYYASRYAGASVGDYMERITPVVFHTPFHNSKYALIDPNPEVNQGVQCMVSQLYNVDGTINPVAETYKLAKWPSIMFSHTPPYADGQVHTHLQVPTIGLGNPENFNLEQVVTFSAMNDTNVTLKGGDVVRFKKNLRAGLSEKWDNATAATALGRHCVVWAPSGNFETSYAPGTMVHLVAVGRNVKAKVDALPGDVKEGDFYVAIEGQKGLVIPAADLVPNLSNTFDGTNFTAVIDAIKKVHRVEATAIGRLVVDAIAGATSVTISIPA